MPALRLYKIGEEVFRFRVEHRRRSGAVMHGQAQLLRHVRDRSAAFALTPADFARADALEVWDRPIRAM